MLIIIISNVNSLPPFNIRQSFNAAKSSTLLNFFFRLPVHLNIEAN